MSPNWQVTVPLPGAQREAGVDKTCAPGGISSCTTTPVAPTGPPRFDTLRSSVRRAPAAVVSSEKPPRCTDRSTSPSWPAAGEATATSDSERDESPVTSRHDATPMVAGLPRRCADAPNTVGSRAKPCTARPSEQVAVRGRSPQSTSGRRLR